MSFQIMVISVRDTMAGENDGEFCFTWDGRESSRWKVPCEQKPGKSEEGMSHLSIWQEVYLAEKKGQWKDTGELAMFESCWDWLFKALFYAVQWKGWPQLLVFKISNILLHYFKINIHKEKNIYKISIE